MIMINPAETLPSFPPFSVFAHPGIAQRTVAPLLSSNGAPPGIFKVPEEDPATTTIRKDPNGRGTRSAVCANCAQAGHYYRECKLPIASFGIVCYRLRVDFNTSCIRPEFLLVQRRDSLFWIEFLRGKYDETDQAYIRKMLAGMTVEEQALLRADTPFPDLWAKLWSFSNLRNCMTNEFCMSRDKYAALQAGSAGALFADILASVQTALPELEWGFPKGRRSLHEAEADCALREFVEETGIPGNSLHVYGKTIDDTFVGSNGVNYSHTYFLARQIRGATTAQDLPIRSQQQAREISHVRWTTLEEASKKLTGSRGKILERAHRLVVQSLIGSW